MNLPLVSVVTPFYNTARYLDECIRSVRGQSMADFEYVLLDNCSTDGSRQIAIRHAEADRRIRIVTNDRLLDQVENYNRALTLISAESRYCKIVQADDWIHRRCLDEMVTLAETDAQIGLVSSLRLVGRAVGGTGLPYDKCVFDGRDIGRQQLAQGRFYFGSPTTVMYRADLVRDRRPFFESGRLHEDTERCYEILSTWKFGFVHEVLSFSRTENESVMARARRFNAMALDRLICIERFGPLYLDADLLATTRQRQWHAYYRYLGGQWLTNRDPEFWEYHRKGLASIGRALPMTTVCRYAALKICSYFFNPGDTATSVARAIRGRLVKGRGSR